MLLIRIAISGIIYTHLYNNLIECRILRYDHILMEKRFGSIDKCSVLEAESATSSTVCLSTCAKSSTDPKLQCNISANTWNYDLVLESPATFSTVKGHNGCSTDESRYKCVAIRNDSRECDQMKHLNPGDHCYTKCGEEKCPEDGFKPTTSEDFKKGGCSDGFRVRCEAAEKISLNKPRKFTVEMELTRGTG